MASQSARLCTGLYEFDGDVNAGFIYEPRIRHERRFRHGWLALASYTTDVVRDIKRRAQNESLKTAQFGRSSALGLRH